MPFSCLLTLGTKLKKDVKNGLAKLQSSVETTVGGRPTRSHRSIVDNLEFRGRLVLANHSAMRQMMGLSIYHFRCWLCDDFNNSLAHLVLDDGVVVMVMSHLWQRA